MTNPRPHSPARAVVGARDLKVAQEVARHSNVEGPAVRLITSDQVLSGQNEVWIRHGREMYRLRKTRQGKLILTK